MTTNATALQPEIVTLPLERIRESSTNPRQRFGDLDELAASIRTHGLLQPILVRPVRKDFELVVGARRLRAARLAGLTGVPAQIKSLDDRSAREVQIIENLQRQDVHPLEEADGYKALLESTPSCTIDEIAAKVGKSKAYVYQRLSLTRLAPKVRETVASDALPLSYALKLAPLAPAAQLEALEGCFRPLGGDAKYSREWLEPIGRLQEWLSEHARLDPRSEHAKVLLPELAAQVEEAEQAQAATVLAVSTLHFHTDRREPKPILARSWKLAEGKHKCHYARPAVIELGEQQGRFIQVCIEKKKCTKHWPSPKSGVTANAQRADQERRRATTNDAGKNKSAIARCSSSIFVRIR
jgi:ParB/RepB/Spo0J family partition protein